MSDLHPIFQNVIDSHFPDLNGNWVEHDGGPCPRGLLPTTDRVTAFVQVRYRDGEISRSVAAPALAWRHNGTASDVMAYREVPAPTQTEPFSHTQGLSDEAFADLQNAIDHEAEDWRPKDTDTEESAT